MNERLKELYQQAHMVREYPLDDPMRGGNPPTVYWESERSAKKFAELIIQDCVTQIALLGTSNFENEDIMWAVERSIESIEERFGIS